MREAQHFVLAKEGLGKSLRDSQKGMLRAWRKECLKRQIEGRSGGFFRYGNKLRFLSQIVKSIIRKIRY